VGVVLVSEHLMSSLATVPMEEVGVMIPVPTGENVRMVTGQIKTTGEALAHPGAMSAVSGSGKDWLHRQCTSAYTSRTLAMARSW